MQQALQDRNHLQQLPRFSSDLSANRSPIHGRDLEPNGLQCAKCSATGRTECRHWDHCRWSEYIVGQLPKRASTRRKDRLLPQYGHLRLHDAPWSAEIWRLTSQSFLLKEKLFSPDRKHNVLTDVAFVVMVFGGLWHFGMHHAGWPWWSILAGYGGKTLDLR